MNPPILISMDHNENQPTNKRPDAVKWVCENDPTYQWCGFWELPVDMQMQSGCDEFESCPDSALINRPECKGKCHMPLFVNIELKEISDFWQSKNTGHLGQQIMTMIAEGQPGVVAVFGSLQETMDQVPKIKSDHGRVQKRTHFDIASDANTARAMWGDAMACNVPIFFLSSNYETSFKWILSMAKNILCGPTMASWLPRFPVEPIGYGCLCSVPGIGDVAAKGLLQAYGGISQISNECKHNPEAIAALKVNGKALGKAKAAKLVEVFG
jgi:ERCC4-type nuclease